MMRVCHVSHNDIMGGAARATNRIHKALLKNNVDSWIVGSKKYSDEKNVKQIKFGHIETSLRSRIEAYVNKSLNVPNDE